VEIWEGESREMGKKTRNLFMGGESKGPKAKRSKRKRSTERRLGGKVEENKVARRRGRRFFILQGGRAVEVESGECSRFKGRGCKELRLLVRGNTNHGGSLGGCHLGSIISSRKAEGGRLSPLQGRTLASETTHKRRNNRKSRNAKRWKKSRKDAESNKKRKKIRGKRSGIDGRLEDKV